MPQAPKLALLVLPEFLERAATLSKDTKSKLVRILWLLSEDFRHPGLQCKKVQGARGCVFECRVDQGIRLIYDVDGGSLRCWYVGEHDAALSFASSGKIPSRKLPVDDVVFKVLERDEQHILECLRFGSVPDRFIVKQLGDMFAGIPFPDLSSTDLPEAER